MVGRAGGLTRRPRQGYNLVFLVVLLMVANILIAVALPTWTNVMQREREKELIFRGIQYAEAIRVFQVRHGRFPTSLRELLETEPRSIRQLWTDPFRDDGKWGLVLAQSTPTGQQAGRDAVPGGSAPRGLGDGEEDDEGDLEPPIPTEDVSVKADFGAPKGIRAAGPIIGVRSVTEKDAVMTFMGSNSIEDWLFTVELIPLLPEAVALENVPRLTSRYIGRPFPQGLEPESGNLPGSPSKQVGSPTAPRTRRSTGQKK